MSTQDLVHPHTAVAPGTPPIDGTGGERGSSAFVATDDYNTNGTMKNDVIPEEGPLRGVQYYNDPGMKRTGTSAVIQGPHYKKAQDPDAVAPA